MPSGVFLPNGSATLIGREVMCETWIRPPVCRVAALSYKLEKTFALAHVDRVYTGLMIPAGLKKRVHALLGPRGYLDRPEDLALYEYDGGVDKHAPDLVAFPRDTDEVAALVKMAQEFGVPFVGRGAGTGFPAAPSRARAA